MKKSKNLDVRNNDIIKHYNDGGGAKAPVQNTAYHASGVYGTNPATGMNEQVMSGPASTKVYQSAVPVERYNPNSVNRNTPGKAYSKLKKGGSPK